MVLYRRAQEPSAQRDNLNPAVQNSLTSLAQLCQRAASMTARSKKSAHVKLRLRRSSRSRDLWLQIGVLPDRILARWRTRNSHPRAILPPRRRVFLPAKSKIDTERLQWTLSQYREPNRARRSLNSQEEQANLRYSRLPESELLPKRKVLACSA